MGSANLWSLQDEHGQVLMHAENPQSSSGGENVLGSVDARLVFQHATTGVDNIAVDGIGHVAHALDLDSPNGTRLVNVSDLVKLGITQLQLSTADIPRYFRFTKMKRRKIGTL